MRTNEIINSKFTIAGFESVHVDRASREEVIRAAKEEARQELGDAYDLVEIGEIASMNDLATQGRLDAAIDKCLKRLLFVKGLKSISASSSSAPSNRITGPSEAA